MPNNSNGSNLRGARVTSNTRIRVSEFNETQSIRDIRPEEVSWTTRPIAIDVPIIAVDSYGSLSNIFSDEPQEFISNNKENKMSNKEDNELTVNRFNDLIESITDSTVGFNVDSSFRKEGNIRDQIGQLSKGHPGTGGRRTTIKFVPVEIMVDNKKELGIQYELRSDVLTTTVRGVTLAKFKQMHPDIIGQIRFVDKNMRRSE